MSVCNVPDKVIVKEEYNNKILKNLKQWGYIGKAEAKDRLGEKYKPKKKSEYDKNWIPFNVKTVNGKPNAWLDPNLDHPIKDIGGKCVWKIMDGVYKIVSYGKSSRISKSVLIERTDSNNNAWKGYKRIKI